VHGEAFEEVRGEAQFAVGGEDVFEDCVAFGCGEEVQGAGGLWRGGGALGVRVCEWGRLGEMRLTDCSKGSSRQRGRVSRSQRKVVVVGGMVGGIARWRGCRVEGHCFGAGG